MWPTSRTAGNSEVSVRVVRSRSAVAGKRPSLARTAAVRDADVTHERWTAESWLVVVMLLVFAILRAIPKLTYSESQDDSTVGLFAFVAMYGFAAYRLYVLRERALRIARKSVVLMAFLALFVLSTTWSLETLLTFKDSLELVGTTVFAWYIVTRFTLRHFLQILAVVLTFIVVTSVALVFGSPGRGRMDFGAGPMAGIVGEKNALGATMIVTIITLSLLAVDARKWTARLLLAALWIPSVVLLAGSNSITAAIAGTTSIAVLAVMWGISRKAYFFVASSLLGVVAVAVVVFGVLAVDSNTLLEAVGRSANLTGRADLYPHLLDAVRDRPLFGFGYDSFFASEDALTTYLSDFIEQINWIPPHAHNSFLQITLDTGLVGLAIFLVVLATAFKRTIAMLGRGTKAIDRWPLGIVLFLTLGSYDETYFALNNTLLWIFFVAALLYPIRDARSGSLEIAKPLRKVARALR